MSHSHSHDAHSHGEHTAETNRKHFDEQAKTYTNESSIYLTSKCAQAILEVTGTSLSGKSALDFACGPGLVSQAIARQGAKVTGVDISGNMVTEFNEQAKIAGLQDSMHAVRLNSGSSLAPVADQQFDLIFCVHSYHHFHNVDQVTEMLAKAVKPGGQLVVLDFLAAGVDGQILGDEDAKEKGVVHKHGFTPKDLQTLFAKYFKTAEARESISVAKADFDGKEGSDMLKGLFSRTSGDSLRYVIAIGKQ